MIVALVYNGKGPVQTVFVEGLLLALLLLNKGLEKRLAEGQHLIVVHFEALVTLK